MKKVHIIFVHGVSDSIIKRDYSAGLVKLITSRLKSLFPNQNISDIATFENVNYSEIGHEEEQKVLDAYIKQSSQMYNIFDKTLEGWGLDKIRKLVITAISDAFIYESNFWKEKIRTRVLEKINPYINKNEPVTVVGHSLGSVVSFDTCYFNSRHNKDWKKYSFKPTNLITFGAPIALFSLELDKQGNQKYRYMPEKNPDKVCEDAIQPIKDNGKWYNFFDAQDLIGYPLQELFKGKFNVQDYLVQTGTFPYIAHMQYWENDFIADKITDRLRIDLTEP